MENIVLQVPENLAQQLRQHSDELIDILMFGLRQEQRIHLALQEYREGRASIGHAAYLAGLTVEEIIEQAVKHGIEPHWDEKMIRDELSQ